MTLAKRQKKLDYVLLALLTVFGVMTMSRTFLLCFAVILMTFVFSSNGSLRVKIRRATIVVLFIIVLLLVVYWFMPFILESFLARFQEDDISNGRIGLFQFYAEHILSSPKHLLFGVGMQEILPKLEAIYGTVANVPHNGIQEILVCWGLPGLLLFGTNVLTMVVETKKKCKHKWINFLPLILIFVDIQFGQLIRSGVMLLALSFATVSLCWRSEEE